MRTAQKIFTMCYDKGDIYLGKYEGWYNQREERLVNKKEAEETNYKDQ